MSRAAALVVLLGAGLAGYAFVRTRSELDGGYAGDVSVPASIDDSFVAIDGGAQPAPDVVSADVVDTVVDAVDGFLWKVAGVSIQSWAAVATRPENAAYVQAAHDAEVRYGIPANMIVRLIWQESRYRQDIITGRVKSGAGAVGIMQIVPRWHPGVNPLDPMAAIDYGAKYLRQMFNQFGTWEYALMAYNWGPGNLSRWLKNGGAVPRETANYSTQILADVSALNGGAVA